MKFNSIILCVFCVGIVLMDCSKEKSNENIDNSDKKISLKLDSIGEEFLSGQKVMGFSIAVFRDETMLYNTSYGKTDTLKIKRTQNETIFNLASISKLVGATIAMKIVEEGKLTLDQTLEELLPDYPNKDQARKIKFRHLISMTSGLKEYAPVFDSIYLQTKIPPSKQDYFEFFSQQELDFDPGTYYKYSNSGFVLLPMILERVTGESYDSLINRIINEPTGFKIRHISVSQYDPQISQFFELENNIINYRPYWTWFKGDGGLTASSFDLVQFPSALRDGKIVSKRSFRQMISPTLVSDGIYSEYGLGIKSGSFEGLKLWGHSGADKTFWSMMYYFPEKKITIVTLVNTNNTPNDARALFDKVALIVLDKDLPDHKEDEILEYNKTPFIGEYKRPGDSMDKIVRIVEDPNDHHLYYIYGKPEFGREKMYYLGNGEFWIEKWPTDRVKFEKGLDGNIIALKEYYSGYFSQLRERIN